MIGTKFTNPTDWTRTQSAWHKGGAAVVARREGNKPKSTVVYVDRHKELSNHVAQILIEHCKVLHGPCSSELRIAYVAEFGGLLLETVSDITPSALRKALDEFVVFVCDEANLVIVGAEPSEMFLQELAASAEWVKAIEAQEPKQETVRKRRAKRT